MSLIPDQKPVWDRKHEAGEHEPLRHRPSPLAELSEHYFAEHSQILELGCGVGRDAEFFSKHGHDVLATDASEVVIGQDKQHFVASDIKFEVLNMLDSLPYPNESFDVVYANLSLHYYSNKDTRRIVQNVKKVLKPEGLFVFACKSVNDFHHGNGVEVEKDIFVSDSSHVRHLFSEPYTKDLLAGLFEIEQLDVVDEVYSGERSSILRCIARNA